MSNLTKMLKGRKDAIANLFRTRMVEAGRFPPEITQGTSSDAEAFLAGYRQGWNHGFLDGADMGADLGIEMVGSRPDAVVAGGPGRAWGLNPRPEGLTVKAIKS